MNIDFRAPIVGLDGGEAIENGNVVTLATLSIAVLLTPNPNEQIEPVDKMSRAILAEKIYQSDAPVDVTLDEAALIKSLIGQTCTPLAYLRATQILESAKV